MRRFTLAAVCLACLSALGCVEGDETFTLNPDGSGKVKVDVVMTPPFDPFGPQPKPNEDESLDDMLRRVLRPLLTSPGISAWKDVSASFAPDGRLKFAGTAYFKKLSELNLQGTTLLNPMYAVATAPDGSMVLTPKDQKKGDPGAGILGSGPGQKGPEELAKLSDADLDAYIMKERVRYQSAKPFIMAVLADAKLNLTLVLPGEPQPVKWFKADGRTLSATLDGAKMLAGINKMFVLDAAELRKAYRSKEAMDALARNLTGFIPTQAEKIVVPKPAGPQFDFDKEVAAARAAYPELRKTLKLPDTFQFSDGSGPGPKDPPPVKK